MTSKKFLFLFEKINTAQFNLLTFNKNEFIIVNLFKDNDIKSNFNQFRKKLYHDLYQNSFLEEYATKKFIKKINSNKYFRYLKLSEMNLSDFFWKNYVYYLISILNINKCYYLEDKKIKKLNNNLSIFVKPLITKKLFFKLYLIKILNFLNDLLITVFCYLFIKKKTVSKKTDLIIHPNSNYKIINNSLNFRYILNKNKFSSKNKYYVLSLSRDNSDKVINFFKFLKDYNSLKNIKNLIILEAYSSIMSLFKSYFPKFNNDLSYQNINLNLFKYDLGKNLFFKSMIYNFKLKNSHISSNYIIYPFFEFIFGRIISEVFTSPKFKTISFQHGSLGLFHKWRFYNSINLISDNVTNLLPHSLIFEGSSTYNWYNKININKKILKPNRSLLKINKYKEDYSKVMIMLDMHDWENLLNSLLTFVDSHKYILVIRPHPSRVETVRKYLKKKNNTNIILDFEKNLKQSINLYKPILFLIGQSGVATELILNKLNVAIILNSNFQNYSPVLFFKNIKKFFFTKNFNVDLNNFIQVTNFKIYTNSLYSEVKKLIKLN